MSVNTYINGQLLRVGGFTQFQPSQSIQVSFMPEASATYEDKIFQYVGATTEDYINGLFYRCVSDGEETPTYSWEAVNTEPMPTASAEEVADMWSNPISGTKIIQRADWELMTTEEKHAEGLIIIQDSNSGFVRGIYVNGADYVPPLYVYNEGVEGVAWENGQGATKNVDNISLSVGAGSFTNYAITSDAVDLSAYSTLQIRFTYNDTESTLEFDLSEYNDSYYISFVYLTTNDDNSGYVGLKTTKGEDYTFEIYRNAGGASNLFMSELVLS